MKICLICITVLILVFGFEESNSLEEENSQKWIYQGAVSTTGCKVLEGQILEDRNGDYCNYRDKLLKIVNTYPECGDAITQWIDSKTQKIFNYTSTCDHPFFCDEHGGR